MPDGESWLLRPVSRGWCRYESLIDGTLGIYDIAKMNDAISVLDENQQRIQEAQPKGRR